MTERAGRAQQVQWYLTGSGIPGVMRTRGHATVLTHGYALYVEGKVPNKNMSPLQRLDMIQNRNPAAVPISVRYLHNEVERALVMLTLENFVPLIGGKT